MSAPIADDEGWLDLSCSFCSAPQPLVAMRVNEGGAISGPLFNCINCGRENHMPGTYMSTRINGRLHMVFHDMTLDDLVRAREQLERLRQQPDVTVDDVAAAVSPTSEGLADWIRNQGNRMEIWAMIAMLLAVIAILLPLFKDEQPPPPSQINQVIVQVETTTLSEGPVPRNSRCPCGSGAKFKKCHGRHPTAGGPPSTAKSRPQPEG